MKNNMYEVYFDSGTTNTRMYVLNTSGELIFTSKKSVGSKATVLTNDRQFLVRELYALYNSMLEHLHLKDSDISSIWMSGMVTSKNGIIEVPYISVPITLKFLADEVFTYFEPNFFRRDILFIPGIKSVPKELQIEISNVDQVNNMRGEETEIMGILSCGIATKGSCVIVLPGSHTQAAILQDGIIVNIISTVTGELYKAIQKETILSENLTDVGSAVDKEMVALGYKNLVRHGFNRAIYIVRSLLLFTEATDFQRSSYLEGVLNGGVIQAVKAVLGEKSNVNFFISGSETQYQIFSAITEKYCPDFTVRKISVENDFPFSLLGFKAIKSEYSVGTK